MICFISRFFSTIRCTKQKRQRNRCEYRYDRHNYKQLRQCEAVFIQFLPEQLFHKQALLSSTSFSAPNQNAPATFVVIENTGIYIATTMKPTIRPIMTVIVGSSSDSALSDSLSASDE